MTFRRPAFLLILILSSYIKVSGQVAPPPMAMPTDSSNILIDKIIAVTNHEQYFTDYCTKKVMAYAEENNWTQDKINEILGSIKFKYYNSTIYNSYAFYTPAQLTKLLGALTELMKDSKSCQTFILTNQMMQINLDLFVKSVLEGKYVTNND